MIRKYNRKEKSGSEFRKFEKTFLGKILGGTFDSKGQAWEMGTWAQISGASLKYVKIYKKNAPSQI